MQKICLLIAAAVFAASSAMPAVALTAPKIAPETANAQSKAGSAEEAGETVLSKRRGQSLQSRCC